MKRIPTILLVAMTMLCSGCTEPSWLSFRKLRQKENVRTNYEERLVEAGVSNFTLYVKSRMGWKLSPMVLIRFAGSGVTNLLRIEGMDFHALALDDTEVSDLSPLKGMPLEIIGITKSPVTDLSPLKDMALKQLGLHDSMVTDLSPLKGLRLERLTITKSPVTDLSPLKGMALKQLRLHDCIVADLSPLKGMKLERFHFTLKHVTNGIGIVRNMKTLEKINDMPVAEFWQKLDAGEFGY